MKKIGRLRFQGDSCGVSQFGPVYRGWLDDTNKVHIERIEKCKFEIDKEVLIQHHAHILQYYVVEQDPDFL